MHGPSRKRERAMLKNTRVLPKDVLDVVKRSRPVYSAARALRFAAGERFGARPVSGLSGRVHYNDFMLLSTDPADVDHYVRGANRFIDIIERSCAEAGRDPASLRDVLEVGCGYGRIVRELRKRLPRSAGLCFGRDRRGRPVHRRGIRRAQDADARTRRSGIRRPFRPCLSALRLYAHAPRHGRRQSAARCGRVETGRCGGDDRAWSRLGRHLRALPAVLARQDAAAQALARDGYYYERYPYYYDDYGLTWFTRPAFEALVAEATPQLTAVAYHALDLDAHQDVFVYRKDA